jgi:hypothetical protein
VSGLHPVNIRALGANAFFVPVHFFQTHIWDDGFAQNVSFWSSQGSVIVPLVMVSLIENQRRRLFFGKKAPIKKAITRFVCRCHGYVFAWAAIYRFWYHPMENTSGHLIGFFYIFLIMLQGSLSFARVYLNRLWTTTLGAIVLIHGTLVAVY